MLVVVIALVSGGVLYWRGLLGHSTKAASAKGPSAPANAPAAKASHAPIVLPANAPKIGADLDPEVIYPFAKRLTQVNGLAHKVIVTNAEYHDSDAGQRYFTAVVTSCKDLNAIWPIKRGLLDTKVEAPLHLKADFPTFAFVEYYQQGQWGVAACDGTT